MAPRQTVQRPVATRQNAPKASFFDRFLSSVGLQRTNAAATRASVFKAGGTGRLQADWFSQVLSADQELKGDLRKMRGTARALVRDNSFASRYVNLLAENVIGPNGIRMQARAKNARGALHTALNNKIEDAWREWSYAENASVDGKLSFVDIEHLAVKSLAQDGEVIIRMIKGADNPFHFALQFIDPDQLDEQYNVMPVNGSNEIRMGIEVNQFGKPLTYWLWNHHPNDPRPGQKRVPVPAEEIIHLFIVKRVGQSRGVTWFAPVMFDQQMAQGYQEAEITAARIGSSNMAAVEYDPEKGGDGGDDDEEGGEAIPLELAPGLFMRLGPGEKLVNTDFNHPSTAFGPFMKGIQRSIATGLNVCYPTLSGDLEAVNLSSIKAGLLGERDFYRVLQAWLPGVFHRRIYQNWAPYAALAGWFSASEARGSERILWQPRGWQLLEPLNDIQAAILARRAGLGTLQKFAAQQGDDFEENLEAIKEERRLLEEYGVTLILDTSLTASRDAASQESIGADDPPAPSTPEADDTSATPIRRRKAALAGA